MSQKSAFSPVVAVLPNQPKCGNTNTCNVNVDVFMHPKLNVREELS